VVSPRLLRSLQAATFEEPVVALARDRVLAFVRGHPEPLCAACLGRTLRLLFEHVLESRARKPRMRAQREPARNPFTEKSAPGPAASLRAKARRH
jgi:hypothetical protein